MLRTTAKRHSSIEKRRIRISSKRQITIPAQYYEAMGLGDEVECIYSNNMLILLPVRNEGSAFAEQILSDLIEQGYSGQELLKEFKRITRQVRPAVEKIIAEADAVAREASEGYIDRTAEIFGEEESNDSESEK